MADAYKATRQIIEVAGKEVEVFQIPNGEFRYSITSVASLIGKGKTDAFYFFDSKAAKALIGEDYTRTSDTYKVERTRVSAITDLEANAYITWKAQRGDKEAIALLGAGFIEMLHRRACTAFGVEVAEAAHEERTRLNFERIQDAIAYQVAIEQHRANPDLYASTKAKLDATLEAMSPEEHEEYCRQETTRRQARNEQLKQEAIEAWDRHINKPSYTVGR
ncbi:hypothetical protein I8748_23405 [Nostoc sp. CENA67]|uniref:Uncharacterized protein n=1 Tax=Amazonocrinis nigriterrae CENA67 TaxID=2794033 RepID=A0A8J7HYZ4_9NOST|nr:hypothetical protein [Amazonocrinis nigriterrae]MBH8565094.1 hypothetical protein [Amazonocrinis nigriterrae CENA67]